MTPERWQRIQSIFDRVVDLEPDDRDHRIEELCGEDDSLRAQVRSLISAYEDADEVLDRFEGEELVPRILGPSSRSGTRVGRYAIKEELGRGGMGVVYRARDTQLDRSVVLKFLPPHLSTDENAKRRFVQEARSASSLDHPHICTVHEIGETEEGQVYIVMSYYAGRTLKERVADGTVEPGEAAEWARQIVRGLRAAHAADIVHRDVKPGNIMLTEDGLIKLLDFGLAKSIGQDLTRSGSTLGTVLYMSPEQARGEAVDQRTDYWSLGIVLYEMLAGRPPFRGAYDQTVLYSILHEEPEPLAELRPDLPSELSELVHRLLAKDPDERLSDPEEIDRHLRRIGTADGVDGSDARSEPLPARSRAASSPLRWSGGLLAALILLLALIGGGMWGLGLLPGTADAPAYSGDVHTVAVLPFTVRGDAELDFLGEGMVDILSTKLDGAGQLKSIDPNALLGYLARRPDRVLDPNRGREVARHFGAGQFILGRVLRVGDQLQLSATLYRTDGTVMTSARIQTPSDTELLGAVDDLTQQLIAGQLTSPAEQLASVGVFTTSSVPALKSYLTAEQLVRTGAFEEAVAHLEEAVATDSTFGLAWYRLATTLGWIDPARSLDVIERAVAHSDPLPERTRNLILGYRDFLNGRAGEAEQRYRTLIAQHPDEIAAWQQLGEVLFHYNPFLGRRASEAREPFERALAYDPDNREMIIHLMDLAIQAHDFRRLDSLLATYGESGSEAWRLDAYRTTSRFGQSPPAVREAMLADLDRLGTEDSFWLVHHAFLAQEIDLAGRLVRTMMRNASSSTQRAEMAGRLSMIEITRGRWQAAAEAGQLTRERYSDYALVYSVLYHTLPQAPLHGDELEALRRAVRAWSPEEPIGSEAAPKYREDEEAVRAYLAFRIDLKLGDLTAAESRLPLLEREATRRGPRTLSHMLYHSARSHLSWQKGDSETALEALRTSVETGFPSFVTNQGPLYDAFFDRYLRGEILQTLGRYEEALDWYRSITQGASSGSYLLLGPSYRRQAEIYEELGRYEEAAEQWRNLIDLWEEADPHLQPQVDTARKHLAALTGEGALQAAGTPDGGTNEAWEEGTRALAGGDAPILTPAQRDSLLGALATAEAELGEYGLLGRVLQLALREANQEIRLELEVASPVPPTPPYSESPSP